MSDEVILNSIRQKKEELLHTSHAAVLAFNIEKNNWDPKHAGIASVFILVNRKAHTVRVAAGSPELETVLDSPLTSELLYQKPSESFVQWKCGNDIHGLNFSSIPECDEFDKLTNQLVEILKTGGSLPAGEKAEKDKESKREKKMDKKSKRDSKRKEMDDMMLQNKHLAKLQMPAKKGGSLPLPSRSDSGPELTSAASTTDLGTQRSLITATDLTNREKLVKELYTSECTYVEGLMLLQHQYVSESKSVLSEEEARTVFGNVSLITNCNKALLKDLRMRVANWTDDQVIGDIFERMLPFLKMYEQYCSNHHAATNKLIELKKKKDVTKFLSKCEASVNKSLESLLITPVQRLPRYVLMLKDLVKCTDETHPDFITLKLVAEKAGAVASQVNRGMRAAAAQHMFYTLQQQKKFAGLQELVAPHREFITFSDMNDKKPQLSIQLGDSHTIQHILLFTDMAVLALGDGHLVDRVPLSSCWAEDLNASSNKFLLITPDQTRRFIVECVDLKTKKEWLTLFTETINEWVETSKMKVMESGERLIEYTWNSSHQGGPAKGDSYRGYFRVGRMHGEGRYTTSNGDIYKGTWQENKMEGNFTVHYNSGAQFTGTMAAGLPHGQGKLIHNDNCYDGEWRKGAKSGTGKMSWGEKKHYVGEFEANRMNGVGTLTIGDATYVGEWKDDVKHGKGVLTLPGGDRYDGQWSNDARQGQGVLETAHGVVYSGAWKDNKKHGHGVELLRIENNEKESKKHRRHRRNTKDTDSSDIAGTKEFVWKYEGTFLNDVREGNGVLIVNDASGELRYDGGFHAGRPHGKGKQVWSEGEYTGQWVAGHRSGSGSMIYASGDRYEGQWENDVPHGQGVFVDGFGNKYEGSFKGGKRTGAGKYESADKRYVYEGEWLDDRRNGKGKETDASGMTFHGTWDNGQRTGKGALVKKGERIDSNWKANIPVGDGQWSSTVKGDNVPAPKKIVYSKQGVQTAPLEPSLSNTAPLLIL